MASQAAVCHPPSPSTGSHKLHAAATQAAVLKPLTPRTCTIGSQSTAAARSLSPSPSATSRFTGASASPVVPVQAQAQAPAAAQIVTSTPLLVSATDSCEVRLNLALQSFIQQLVADQVGKAVRGAVAALPRPEPLATAATQHHSALEAQVRNLAESQSRMLAMVNNLSGAGQRQNLTHCAIEHVMKTVEELRHSVQQDAARQDSAVGELRRMLALPSPRPRGIEETDSIVARMRQEVSDLKHEMQRMEKCLKSVGKEVLHLNTEVLSPPAATLSEEIQREVEAKINNIHTDLRAISSDFEAREASSLESVQTLARRVAALETAQEKQAATATVSVEELQESIWKLETRINSVSSVIARENSANMDSFRRDVASLRKQLTEVWQGLERAEAQWKSVTAADEKLENRLQDKLCELQRHLEARVVEVQDEIYAQYRTCSSELRADVHAEVTAIAKNQPDEAFIRSTISSHMRESIVSLQRESNTEITKSSADLRAELRASLKRVQGDMAALDEQLWITDHRLGGRIDQLAHAVGASASATLKSPLDSFRVDDSLIEGLDISSPRPSRKGITASQRKGPSAYTEPAAEPPVHVFGSKSFSPSRSANATRTVIERDVERMKLLRLSPQRQGQIDRSGVSDR